MNGAFYIGATGLQAQQRGLDVIANNIANINTTAYKRSEIRFAELVAQPARDEAVTPAIVAVPEALSGVQARTSPRIYEQGDLRQTGKPFDLAIDGDGFVEVLGPGGQTWLWRGGSLKINSEGLLATDSGQVLKALIDVPEDASALTIDSEGVVRTVAAGDTESVELGTIQLVMPKDRVEAEPVGAGFYRIADDQEVDVLDPVEARTGVFVQGSLEQSNVDLSTEIVQLLLMQRSYGANAQVVQAGDQLMAIANNLRR